MTSTGATTEPATVAAAEPVEVAPAPVEKEPRAVPDGDFPWMRAKASGVVGFYNYNQTPLLEEAEARRMRHVDGLGMLLHQGRPGFEAWFGAAPQVDDALRAAVLSDDPL